MESSEQAYGFAVADPETTIFCLLLQRTTHLTAPLEPTYFWVHRCLHDATRVNSMVAQPTQGFLELKA